MFSSVLLVEGRPVRGWSSSDMSPRLNRENHSQTLAWLKASSLKASRSSMPVSAAVFPNRKQNLMLAHFLLSLPSQNRRKQLQRLKKKIFPRTPLGQLMRRAVMYTHQAGADGTNVPHPLKKKTSLLLGPPTYNKTSIKRYILAIKQNKWGSRSG